MSTQREKIKELVELMGANPDMEIHLCVDSEEILENCKWTAHKIGKIEICPWYEDGDRIITNEDEIYEIVYDNLFDIEHEEDAHRMAQEVVDNCKQVICVYTFAG